MRTLSRVLLLAFVCALLAGCGDDNDSGEAQSSPSTTVAWAFVDDSATPSPLPAEDAQPGEPSNPPQADEAGPQLEPKSETPGQDVELKPLDPCTLVSAEEWTNFAGTGGVVARPLEDGDACGFIDASDTNRLAIAALPRAAGEGWLPADVAAKGAPATVAGATKATWLTNFPVSTSSTMVAEAKSHDVVVELSSRGGKSPEQVRDAAASFAALMIGRLP